MDENKENLSSLELETGLTVFFLLTFLKYMSILGPKTGTYLGSNGRKRGWGGGVRWRATQYIGEGATAVSTWIVCCGLFGRNRRTPENHLSEHLWKQEYFLNNTLPSLLQRCLRALLGTFELVLAGPFGRQKKMFSPPAKALS